MVLVHLQYCCLWANCQFATMSPFLRHVVILCQTGPCKKYANFAIARFSFMLCPLCLLLRRKDIEQKCFPNLHALILVKKSVFAPFNPHCLPLLTLTSPKKCSLGGKRSCPMSFSSCEVWPPFNTKSNMVDDGGGGHRSCSEVSCTCPRSTVPK